MKFPARRLSTLANLLGTTALVTTAWSVLSLANDACETSNTVVTCTGDQSDGISVRTENGVRTLIVDTLTEDINPPGHNTGVSFQSTVATETIRIDYNGSTSTINTRREGISAWMFAEWGGEQTGEAGHHAGGTIVNFNGGTINVLKDGVPGRLIASESIAGSGGSGKDDYKKFGMDGGAGGDGGAATIRVGSGGVFTSYHGTPAYNIFRVDSQGGDGGKGGDNSDFSNPDSVGDSSGDGGKGGSAEAVLLSVGVGTTASNTTNAPLALVTSTGGNGGTGGKMSSILGDAYAGKGGDGGAAGTADLVLTGGEYSQSGTAPAFQVESVGGDGGLGGHATSGHEAAEAGEGGAGGTSGKVTGKLNGGQIFTSSTGGTSILLQSVGGRGGDGGSSNLDTGGLNYGGDGGVGGDAGDVEMTSADGGITIVGNASDTGSHGVHLASIAGDGGHGGRADGATSPDTVGGDGGKGGKGGDVFGGLFATITTSADQGQGIFMRSYGGAGGDGGAAVGGIGTGTGGAGSGSGPAGSVNLTFSGDITTLGKEASGILIQSVGGFSGDAGQASGGFLAYGAGSQSAGAGGSVSASLDDGTKITASGDNASAVLVQSVGGGGGRGSSASGFVGMGGDGSAGGAGGEAELTIGSGSVLSTAGNNSAVAGVASVGGGGGDGGGAVGVVSLGGSSGPGGDGGSVTAHNKGRLSSTGYYSDGLYVASIGGGGGSAHSAVGMAAIGGKGGAGGDGGLVTVENAGDISTSGMDSDGIFLTSIGGGGGSGSSAYAISAFVSVAIGGSGGDGGKGDTVTYDDKGASGYTVSTTGDRARGLVALSAGGGGGDGGTAVSASAGPGFSLAIANSGAGHGGGDGGAVSVSTGGAFSTKGGNASAIHAHSVGGGGGNAGNSIAASGSNGVAATLSIGGAGGSGGNAGEVVVETTGATGVLSTEGSNSSALVAESTGGGGGHSGTTIGGSVAGRITMGDAIGGSGGAGGDGGAVTVKGNSTAGIVTKGDNSAGVYAHSVGGGGGYSGTTAAGSAISEIAVNAAVGGSGGDGGRGSSVNVTLSRDIKTEGDNSAGINAMSVGGGGGHSGITASGALVSNVTVNVSVGGSGGTGADSDNVSVTSNGSITTKGHSSTAVNAKSIAGGGGASHFTGAFSGVSKTGSISASIGGHGGKGGASGNVAADIHGDLTTSGHFSAGASIMSVAGGGGESGTTMTASGASKVEIGVAIGGAGGEGGKSGAATLHANSNIVTSGDVSAGLDAKSIGGAGGSSGFVADVSLVSKGNVGVAIGADAGDAGTSAKASVESHGSVSTSGTFSIGIIAQSIAGQGGSAKGSLSGSLAAGKGGKIDVTIGGAGGDGGVAGDAVVQSYGSIATRGALSYGILAQSVGGSGGDGGLAAQGGFSSGSVSAQIGVSIGGSGGNGGTSGDVSVSTFGAGKTITTDDFGSHGIFALSTGGNGGTGGSVYTGNVDWTGEKSVNVNIDIGGSGGQGGKAGTVSIDNQNAVTTTSFLATGLYAASIGGSGGDGGTTYSILASVKGSPKGTVSVDVGGSGGGGAVGGAASISNSGKVTTQKGGSTGIYVQSIGGGGGRGGSSANLNLTLKTADDAAAAISANKVSLNAGISVGGSGGSGKHAGTATLSNSGAVTTMGIGADALVAQSVGGGGGDGGTASTTSINAGELGCTFAKDAGLYKCKSQKGEESEVEVKMALAIGGSGGSGGNGESVEVTNSGALVTNGNFSHGIVAQSVGGGGGTGGDGGLGLDAWTSNKQVLAIETGIDDRNELPTFTSASMSIGGSGGAEGNGETVSVTSSGAIKTLGDYSFGIHAQSIGGGGGKGGAGTGTFWTTATVGGKGGGAGKTGVNDGGDVNITLNEGGSIVTSGKGSAGLLAQSVGGGGGIAGDIDDGVGTDWDGLHVGFGIPVERPDGPTGDGGDLTIAIHDTITTSGDGAHGVYLQSVGGGGGILGADPTANSDIVNYVGNNGNEGSSGKITASVSDIVLVTGERSVGLFAQSVAGAASTDTSGAVTINVDKGGRIRSSGTAGRAIFAQSVNGSGSNAAIEINIDAGAEVSNAYDGGETIALMDGHQNKIVNHGTLLQDSINTSSYVIRTDGRAALSISNYGMLGGAIRSSLYDGDTGTAQAIDITNEAGGSFGLGRHSDLAGGELTNNGSLSAGAFGVVAQVGIGGIVTQTASGNTQVDIAFGKANDLIDVDDTSKASTFAGTITPHVVSGTPADGHKGQLEIIESKGDLITTGLSAVSSATVDYGISRGTRSDGYNLVLLDYKVDYTPWDGDADAQSKVRDSVRGRINANHKSVGDNVRDLIASVQGPPNGSTVNPEFVEDLSLVLLRVGEVEDLVDVYDRYAPGEIFAPVTSARFSSLRFSNELNSCPAISEEGLAVYSHQGGCYWGHVSGTGIERQRDGLSVGYDETVFTISAGAQAEISDGWFAGGALSYELSDMSNDRFSGDGDRFQLGAVLKREIGPTTISASLSGGYSQFDLAREVMTLGGITTAKSDPGTAWVAAHARISHHFDLSQSTYIKPRFDVGVQYTHQDAYTETGAGDFGLVVDAMSNTFVTLNPVLEIGTDFSLGGMSAEANFSAGVLGVIGGNEQSANVRFIGAGSNGPGFTLANDGDDLFVDLNASLIAQLNEQTTLRANVGALIGETQQQYSAGLRLNIGF